MHEFFWKTCVIPNRVAVRGWIFSNTHSENLVPFRSKNDLHNIQDQTKERRESEERGTSVSRRHFSTTTLSWTIFNLENSSSSFLLFQRALRFWNQTATCRGSNPSSEAILSFLSDSNLCSLPKFNSSWVTCSSLSFLFLAHPPLLSAPLLFFLLRRTFASPEHHNQSLHHMIQCRHKRSQPRRKAVKSCIKVYSIHIYM